MWAQLITMHLKAGKESDLPKLFSQLRAAEQPGSGLVRSLTMRDQKIRVAGVTEIATPRVRPG